MRPWSLTRIECCPFRPWLSASSRPTHPGEVFLEDFLIPLGISQKEAAKRLKISYPRMNEIVKGKRTVTPETALRLGRFTGTEPEFWLNLQQAVEGPRVQVRHLEAVNGTPIIDVKPILSADVGLR
jgi:addiction module HigA family antidote